MIRRHGWVMIAILNLLLVYTRGTSQPSKVAQPPQGAQPSQQFQRSQESQPVQDSLQQYLAICNATRYSSTDSLCRYSQLAKKLAANRGDSRAALQATIYCATCALFRAQMDSAGAIIGQALKEIKAATQPQLYESLGQVQVTWLIRVGHYKEVVPAALRYLSFAEEQHDTLYQVAFSNYIGQAQVRLLRKDEALAWYRKGLAISPNPAFYHRFPVLYGNLGVVFATQGQWDSAIWYTTRAIAADRESQNLTALISTLPALGASYIETHRPELAGPVFDECLQAAARLNDPFMTIAALINNAAFHRSPGNYPKSIEECQQAIQLIQKYSLRSQLPYAYMTLSEDYKALGNYKDYALALEQYHSVTDSASRANSAAAIADLQLKYESQKQENTILHQQLELRRKDSWLFGGLVGCVLLVLFTILVFRINRSRQRLKLAIMQKEEQFKAEQAVKDAEEKERRRVAAELHDDLGTRINILSHAASRLMEVSPELGRPFRDTSSELMQSLRETVWTLKQETIDTADVWTRFKNFVSKLRETYTEVQFILQEEESEERTLYYNEALHLIRILQEAAGNAIRHSGCSRLFCEKKPEGESMVFRVCDDGHGFSREVEDRAQGNGLANMRQRAAESHFGFSLRSEPGKGTTAEVRVGGVVGKSQI